MFIPQVIYEHGEPWWMVSAEENIQCVHQIAHWQSYQQIHLVANREDLKAGNY
jgi:hypothetical protein